MNGSTSALGPLGGGGAANVGGVAAVDESPPHPANVDASAPREAATTHARERVVTVQPPPLARCAV